MCTTHGFGIGDLACSVLWVKFWGAAGAKHQNNKISTTQNYPYTDRHSFSRWEGPIFVWRIVVSMAINLLLEVSFIVVLLWNYNGGYKELTIGISKIV